MSLPGHSIIPNAKFVGREVSMNSKRSVTKVASKRSIVTIVAAFTLIIIGCTKEKVVVVQQVINYFPSPVLLIHPAADSFIVSDHPTLIWHKVAESIRYQIQVAPQSDFVNKTIDAYTSDTNYTTISSIPNNLYYWRVRCRDANDTWGNWPDAEIRIFNKSDYINYFELLSKTETYGSPQDVFVRGDTAYVADGQADLTLFDISNPINPLLIRNIDTHQDDFAKGVYISPTDTIPRAYVADMDGTIQSINLRDTSGLLSGSFGTYQNVEDVAGVILPDSQGIPQQWIVNVSSGFNHSNLTFYQMTDDLSGCTYSYLTWVNMPSDAMGLCLDSGYVYVACGTSGLRIVDFHDPYQPQEISSAIFSGVALSVDVKNGFACLAADRLGFYIIDIRNAYNPVVLKNINTAGRAKDVQIVGDYAFIADGSGGLKMIDITIPDSAKIVAAYATPYAYGLWAGPHFIYLCDRDLGLLIFRNKIAQ
jgi:hypothetical protein